MHTDLKDVVQAKYGEAARRVRDGEDGACCSTTCCDPITSQLYDAAEQAALPDTALRASLGCGNPTALAALRTGETVLDLGSGGGIDVLLSARRVGPTGKVYGLDMTDEMLALARENQQKAGATNVEFLKGTIEAIPLPDNSVDVIISNCVINLSSDKDAVLHEAFRVLKPGGRLAVSDVVVRGTVPAGDPSQHGTMGWLRGRRPRRTAYADKLRAAGFTDVDVEPWRIYRLDDARAFLAEAGLDADRLSADSRWTFRQRVHSCRKPDAARCCDSTCCV